MSQSKRHSAIETATSTAVGFVGSYFITLACFHVPDASLATKTLYATLGCTAWSLLRGYYLRRLFNHLHVKRVAAAAGMEVRVLDCDCQVYGDNATCEKCSPAQGAWVASHKCDHLYVSGFGGMGDAVVCCLCGVDKYPEAAPGYTMAQIRGRVINEQHPEWEKYAERARTARTARNSYTPEE